MKFNKDLIDLTYEVVKKNPKLKKEINFFDLINLLCKELKVDPEEFKFKFAGEFYTELLIDPRFIYIGNHLWTLREKLSLAEQKQLNNALYDFSAKDDYMEEYDPEELKPSNKKDDLKDDDLDEIDVNQEDDDDIDQLINVGDEEDDEDSDDIDEGFIDVDDEDDILTNDDMYHERGR